MILVVSRNKQSYDFHFHTHKQAEKIQTKRIVPEKPGTISHTPSRQRSSRQNNDFIDYDIARRYIITGAENEPHRQCRVAFLIAIKLAAAAAYSFSLGFFSPTRSLGSHSARSLSEQYRYLCVC